MWMYLRGLRKNVVVTLLLLGCTVAVGAEYGGGAGAADDPYLIYTPEQLNAIGATPGDEDKHFKLMADLNLDPNLPGGQIFGQAVIAVFGGTFDGNGHTISNLTIVGVSDLGLFGTLEAGAEVRNLGVENVRVTGSGNRIAGLVGGTGWSYGTVVSRCYSTGLVSGGWFVGGLVGNQNSGQVSQCYGTAAVSGNRSVGGLLGGNWGDVSECYSTGAVSGNSRDGGLVGARISGDVTHCVWDVETSGLFGSAGGVGLTTTEMMSPEMLGLNGFGNDPNWVLSEGNDYPRLAWEGAPGDIVPTPEINWLKGHGTADSPYRIETRDELILLSKSSILWDRHFVLGADIDLAPDLPGGLVFEQAVIAVFSGVFDGDGHTISGLTIAGNSDLGLFGTLEFGAEVKNLGVVDVNITGSYGYVGALAANNGPQHRAIGASLTRCYSTGVVRGRDYTGGLVGANYSNSVTECHSVATVSGAQYVGGLLGINEGSAIRCYSRGTASGDRVVGGLLGFNDGNVSQCYSVGTVSGNRSVGGLVGGHFGSPVTQCYSAGVVSGQENGGALFGYNDHGLVTHCIWDVQTSGLSGDTSGVGLTTAEMMNPGMLSLNGFGSDPNWVLDAGHDYPHLAWEGTPGEVIPAPEIDWLQGQGTAAEPYIVDTADQLVLLGKASILWDGHFLLGADIDLDPNQPGGQVFERAVIPSFTGIFEGNDHAVSRLTIVGDSHLGLFGRLEAGGEVRDLRVMDVNVTGSGDYVGALAGVDATRGWDPGARLIHCYSAGTVRGRDETGGLVGWNGPNHVTDCHSSVTVSGRYDVGGLLGLNAGTVTRCSATGRVIGTWEVGGLVGSNRDHVSQCCSTGAVSGTTDVGGLLGWNIGTIANSYSTGNTTGSDYVGGLTAGTRDPNIYQCYATGAVTGADHVSGLINCTGYAYGGVGPDGQPALVTPDCTVITDSFWDIESSGLATSDGGTGKTTAEMMKAETFLEAGWDFVGEVDNGTDDLWWIDEGRDYPRLWWELESVDGDSSL